MICGVIPPEATITESGWYTFKHDFHDFGDRTLEVTMTVSKTGDAKHTIGTWKRNTATDNLDTIVAGNRYGWFTYNAIADLPIDNVTRSGGAIVKKASEYANNGWKTVFKKNYTPFSSQKECENYSKKKLRN
ncbi:hypothetical protein MHU86_8648 [Fragilaria crotonensis]|nr:hypothetical protein MHU86_8648 [Fragilaria crotonensis]